jgi:V8-like Glu-specific endopeptidase
MSDVVDLIQATVRLEQPVVGGVGTVGTGFVVTASAPDGTPRVVLITANHVFARMRRDKVKVGFRVVDASGEWRYAPVNVRIRDAAGDPLWTKHPVHDVAAIELPSGVTGAALPASDLAGNRGLEALRIEPGDEMMVLGYPHGFSANSAGFPILRSGRVASYPLSPASRYPTYLLDFSVFAGNSGGPVYVVRTGGRAVAGGPPISSVQITGLLTQQMKLDDDRLAIGNVTQADYIVETISLMAGVEPAEVAPTRGHLPTSDPIPAAGGPQPSAADRLGEAWRATLTDIGILFRRAWIVIKQAVLDRTTPDARRA